MTTIRLINVRGIVHPEDRAAITYCGRGFAGWKPSEWGNYGHLACPGEYLAWVESFSPAKLDDLLTRLWEATEEGRKPLGCWCVPALVEITAGMKVEDLPTCHAAVWAWMLAGKFGGL